MLARMRRPKNLNSRGKTVGVLLSSLVLVAGCGSEPTSDEPTGEGTSTSGSSTLTTTSKTTSTEPTTQTASVESESPLAASPTPVGPTLVECVYGGGAWTDTGWMSDGTFSYHPECAALRSEQLAKYPYVCPRTDHHVADLSECDNPTGIPAQPSESPDPSIVDELTEVQESNVPDVEPEIVGEPGSKTCEAGDTSAACQE